LRQPDLVGQMLLDEVPPVILAKAGIRLFFLVSSAGSSAFAEDDDRRQTGRE
jgi:hypothetical protein